jgi:hypothetical protein
MLEKEEGRNTFSPFYYDDLTFYVIDILLKFYCISIVIVNFPTFDNSNGAFEL